jgi:hypothetical protein
VSDSPPRSIADRLADAFALGELRVPSVTDDGWDAQQAQEAIVKFVRDLEAGSKG